MAERRHLPIAGQKAAPAPGSLPDPGADEERPPWHWSAIGAVMIFVLWLPLAMIGQWVSARLLVSMAPGGAGDVAAQLSQASGRDRLSLLVAAVGPLLLGFVAACVAGGAFVGRFGGKAGRKEAAVAGLVAASTAWALTAAGPGGLASSWFLWPPVALMGTLSALGGGLIGLRLRPANALPRGD